VKRDHGGGLCGSTNTVHDTREHDRSERTGCSGNWIRDSSTCICRHFLLLETLGKISLPRQTKIP